MSDNFKITKPVRLIECFSGIGAQCAALKRLGIPFVSWKISDWDVNSVKMYRRMHCGKDDTDYSVGLSAEEVVGELVRLCVSTDGKTPMTEQQVRKKGERWQRDTYNDFMATNNLGSITGVHAKDLEIGGDAEGKEYVTVLTYSFP